MKNVLLSFVVITISLISSLFAENPSVFHLNYEKGEKNTYAYTEGGCRIIGKLYSPESQKPSKPKKNPMANIPVVEEYESTKGGYTTTFRKVRDFKKEHKGTEPELVEKSKLEFFGPAVLAPPGSDTTKPVRSLALQAKVYGEKLSVLIWQHKGLNYKVAVRANLLPLASFTVFESANTTYLFFYHPEDLRDSSSGQQSRPNIPKWKKGGGVQAVLLEGPESEEALDGVEALLEIFEVHRKDLQENYRAYKKRAEKLRKEKQNKQPEAKPTESTIYYWKEQ